jgi:hypothetical protein
MVAQSQKQSLEKKRLAYMSHQSFRLYDPTTYFFHKFGSSFNQLLTPLTYIDTARDPRKDKLAFSLEHIKVRCAVTVCGRHV